MSWITGTRRSGGCRGEVSSIPLTQPTSVSGRKVTPLRGPKQTIAADEFHGRTERGVRQELCAHFNLIAMTRLFSGPGDALPAETRHKDRERQAVKFKNAIAIVAANFEEMVLAHAAVIAGIVTRVTEEILRVRSRLRPGRSYPGKSMKPVSKWARRRSLAS